MATLRELVVRFRLKADTKALDGFEKKMNKAVSAAQDLVGFGATLAATYTGIAGGLAFAATSAADFAEETIRSAHAFGMSTSRVQELSFAYQALGASQDDLADTLGTLTDRATDAIEGSKTYRKEFKRIGVSIDELKGKNPGELFDLYVRGVSNATDVNAALTASVRLLGDDLGRRISKGIRTAGSSFQDYIAIVRAADGVFSEEMLEKAQDAQIQFRLLGAVFQMLRRRIGLELAPVFGDFAAKIIKWFSKNSDSVDDFVNRLVNGVQRELGRIGIFARRTNDVVQRVFGGWTNLAEGLAIAMAGVVTAIGGQKVLAAVDAFATALKALTIPAATTGALFAILALWVGALFLIFEDLFVEINGGDSLIGKLIARFEKLGPVSQAIAIALRVVVWLFRTAAEMFVRAYETLAPLLPLLKFVASALALAFGGFILGAMAIALSLWIAIGAAIGLVVSAVNVAIDALVGFVDLLSESLAKFPQAMVNAVDAAIAELANLFGWVDSKIASLTGFSISGAINAGDEPAVGQGPLFPSGVTRGADGNWTRGGGTSVNSQSNSFQVEVKGANSEAEGRAAARGFRSEVEDGGFLESLAERFSYGDR